MQVELNEPMGPGFFIFFTHTRNAGGSKREEYKAPKLSKTLLKLIYDLLHQDIELDETYEAVIKKVLYKAKEQVEAEPIKQKKKGRNLLKEINSLIEKIERDVEFTRSLIKKLKPKIDKVRREIDDEEDFVFLLMVT